MYAPRWTDGLHLKLTHLNYSAQVRVLVEEGKADLAVQDRWGATPLDEAMRAGSRAVMDYLQGLNAPTQKDDDRTVEFLYAASRGDTAKLRHVSAVCTTSSTTCMSSFRSQQDVNNSTSALPTYQRNFHCI